MVGPMSGITFVLSGEAFMVEGNTHTHTHTCMHTSMHACTHTRTQAVSTWFKSIENKRSSSFIKSGTVDFYSSIMKKLLAKSINYVKSITTREEVITVFHPQNQFYLIKPVFGLKRIIHILT